MTNHLPRWCWWSRWTVMIIPPLCQQHKLTNICNPFVSTRPKLQFFAGSCYCGRGGRRHCRYRAEWWAIPSCLSIQPPTTCQDDTHLCVGCRGQGGREGNFPDCPVLLLYGGPVVADVPCCTWRSYSSYLTAAAACRLLISATCLELWNWHSNGVQTPPIIFDCQENNLHLKDF